MSRDMSAEECRKKADFYEVEAAISRLHGEYLTAKLTDGLAASFRTLARNLER